MKFVTMTYFHYTTCKYVVLKEKSLGVAYYIIALVIVLYVLVQLVGNKAYLEVKQLISAATLYISISLGCIQIV